MSKKTLVETLNRWSNTKRFNVSLVEERLDTDVYLLKVFRDGNTKTLLLSIIEIDMSYGNTWRWLLADIIRELRSK